MLLEKFIFTLRNDNHHRMSKVINVPLVNPVDIVLLEHHRVVHLSSIIEFLEVLWAFNIKRLIYNFVKCSGRLYVFKRLFLFLLLLGRILITLSQSWTLTIFQNTRSFGKVFSHFVLSERRLIVFLGEICGRFIHVEVCWRLSHASLSITYCLRPLLLFWTTRCIPVWATLVFRWIHVDGAVILRLQCPFSFLESDSR